MSQSIKDLLKEQGYNEIEIAQIIAFYNEAENKAIPYPFYYALTKFIVGM